MEYLALAIIFYFILRTVGNLVGLLQGDKSRSASHGNRHPQHEWQGPSPHEHTGTAWDEPTFWGEDIEDATWRDVEPQAKDRR